MHVPGAVLASWKLASLANHSSNDLFIANLVVKGHFFTVGRKNQNACYVSLMFSLLFL